LQSRALFVLREDEFADDLLAAFEVALKEYAAGGEKLAYQLGSPFGPYLATRRVPKVAAPAPVARASSARASKGGAAPAPGAEDDGDGGVSDGEYGETAEVSGRAKRVAKPQPAPPTKHSETRAPEEKKKRRSGPSGVSGARKAARAAAEETAAAAEAAAAGHAPPPPPGPRAVETALRTENGELKVQLAKVNEECSSLKGQLAALKATVELREQLAVATAKAACGGLMLRAMTNLGGGARAGSSGVQTPGGEDTPTGSSISQQLAFDAFFGSR
jgi:hypothetical protein